MTGSIRIDVSATPAEQSHGRERPSDELIGDWVRLALLEEELLPTSPLRLYEVLIEAVMATEGSATVIHFLTEACRERVPAEHVPELLAIMATAGFYDESGEWMFNAGLPSKTGVGGGIVSVVPGKFAIAAFSPRLDGAGNSVRAQHAIAHISEELGINIFSPQSVGVSSQR